MFKANCASCHHPKNRITGPPLGDAWDKYAYDREFLFAWVRNGPQMIQEGDPKAIALSQWGPQSMLNFPSLTDIQISSILAYAEQMAKPISSTKIMVMNSH